MRRVTQEDATGCGIACIAMIAGVSYARVRRRAIFLDLITEKPPHYTTSGDLRHLLDAFGVKSTRGRRLKHWSPVSGLSIVGINYSDASDTWHWVVYVPSVRGGYVLDPKPAVATRRRIDFHRMRPRSYIPVAAPPRR